MCGLCGFGLADAELVLGRDTRATTTDEQSVTDGGLTVAHPATQSPTCHGITAETIQHTAGPLSQPTDGFVAALWVRVRQAFAGQPSPSHGL